MLNGQVLTEDVIQQKILNQTLDFGFTYNSPREDEGINILKKLPIKFVMVSSQADLNVSDAIKDNYLFVDWGTSFLQAHSQHFSEMPAPLMRIDVGRIAKRYIKSRTGTAYLPETIVKRDLEMGVLFKVKQAPVIRRSAYIIYNGENGRANTMARKLISQ